MKEKAVLEKIREMMRETLHISRIEEDCRMDEVETWDSLNHLTLIAKIENEFNITIPFEDFIEMISLQRIVDVITRYL